MQEHYDTIQSIAKATSLDPNDVSNALGQIAEAYGEDEVDEALEELAREIPTGEGLTRREARKLLIEEMDTLIILGNQRRLRKFRKDSTNYWERIDAIRTAMIKKEETDVKPGLAPRDPVFVKGLTRRNLDQAVAKARHLGGYEQLLAAAGFSPRSRR